MHRPLTCLGILLLLLTGGVGRLQADTRIRIMAANITSGNNQSYDAGHGTRIFKAVNPDIVLIQEFNVGGNTPAEIRAWIDSTFGTSFQYYREGGAQIPNGIISRYPIRASGEWDDPNVSNRDFAWARIDIPGGKDLWAVSVHLLTSSAGNRNAEAIALRNFINAQVAPTDYLVIGGDFNTDVRNESALTTLSSVVVTSGPYPADRNNNSNTNASRGKPYDWLLADTDLQPLRVATVIGTQSFPNGLVFDSRTFTPIAEVSPVQAGDSAAANMQHMAVIRDFLVPDGGVSPPTGPTTTNPTGPSVSGGQTLLETTTTVASHAWKHFTVTVPTGKATLTLSLSGTSGDADLYVRKAATPTEASFDFRPFLGTSNEQVIVNSTSSPVLSSGTWHVSVNGYSAATFTLKVVVE